MLMSRNSIEKLSFSEKGTLLLAKGSQWVISELTKVEPRLHALMAAVSPTSFLIIGGVDPYRDYMQYSGGALIGESLQD